MSSRQLRRLQQEQNPLELTAQVEEEKEADDADPPTHAPVKTRPSMFASLQDTADGDVDDVDDDDDDDEQGSEPSRPVRSTDQLPASSSKKKKKKNKKKRKKGLANADVARDPSQNQSAPNQDGDLDEIDLALRELGLKPRQPNQTIVIGEGTSQAAAGNAPDKRICQLLGVTTYHLRAANEMKAMFGKDTVAAAAVEEERSRGSPHRQGGRMQVTLEDYLNALPGRGLKDTFANKNFLIQGKKTWPSNTACGLTMQAIDDGNSGREFAFNHGAAYESLEAQFFARSGTYNPDLMIEFLHDNPYHVSSLIVVSKIAKHQGDHSLAADLRERALFTFGRTMLSAFKNSLENGTAKLDFRRLENRQFWLAGHAYLRTLMKKGTNRTALEWAKLLLQLDPSDPYAIGQLIPVIAIKAKQYQWFLDLCETGVLNVHWGYPEQTKALARLRLGDEAGAISDLKAGMQELPWLYSELFKSLNMDVPKAIWGAVVPSEADELYTALYVHQTKTLWGTPQASNKLFEVAHGFDKTNTLAKAPRVSLGVARLVYLDENQDLMALVPRSILHSQPNFEFDPLPPPAQDNVFSSDIQREYFGLGDRQHQTDQAGVAGFGAAAGEPPPGGAINAVLDFMRQRIPGFGGQAPVNSDDLDDEDEGDDNYH